MIWLAWNSSPYKAKGICCSGTVRGVVWRGERAKDVAFSQPGRKKPEERCIITAKQSLT